MSDRFVQHRSGVGTVFPVNDADCNDCWHSHDYTIGKTFYLPKSEYVLRETQDEWRDVTEKCELKRAGAVLDLTPTCVMPGQFIPIVSGYRFRKVHVRIVESHSLAESSIRSAIIVERKDSAP